MMALGQNIPIMHWKNEGNNLYSTFCNNEIDVKMPEIITTAIDSMTCVLSPGKPFVVTDYGTSDGKNFLQCVPQLTEKIRKGYGCDREINIVLNDVLTNDFKSIWQNISEMPFPEGVYFSAVAQSFYKQCVPSETVHLAISVTALHWMSTKNFMLKDSLFPNTTKDLETQKLVKEIAENDWQYFLVERAKELVPGGVLACAILGYGDDDISQLWHKTMTGPMDEAWDGLYKGGIITRVEKERAIIPEYFRSEKQHTQLFLDHQSPVCKSGLELISFEKFSTTNLSECRERYLGKINTANIDGIAETVSARTCEVLKILFTSHLYNALDSTRKEEEKSGILERYFLDLTQILKKDTSLLEFPDDMTFHILIIRKKTDISALQ